MGLTYPPHSLAPLGAFDASNMPDMAIECEVVEPTAPVTIAMAIAAVPAATAPCGVEDKENFSMVSKTLSRAPKASSFSSAKLDDAVKKAHSNI